MLDVMKLYREFPVGPQWLKRCLEHIAAEAIKSARPEVARKPVAWLHVIHPSAHVITDRVKELWIAAGSPKQVENYTMPLYAESPRGRYRGTLKFDGETREITGELPSEPQNGGSK